LVARVSASPYSIVCVIVRGVSVTTPVPAFTVFVPANVSPSTVSAMLPFTPWVCRSTPDARANPAALTDSAVTAADPTVTSPPKLTVPLPIAVTERFCAPVTGPANEIDPLLAVVAKLIAVVDSVTLGVIDMSLAA